MKIIVMNDLHLNEKDIKSVERLERFLDSVRVENEWEDKIIIVVPGDLTKFGSTAQFNKLEKRFENFRNDFAGRVDFLFAPGNHDNSFRNKSVERNRIQFMEKLNKKEQISISDFKGNPDLLGNFKKFNSKLIEENFGIYKEVSEFLSQYIIYSNNSKICINVLNTAHTALKTDSRGIIRIPSDGLDSTFDKNEYDLAISMFHYPETWMKREKYKPFEDYLRKTSDVILIGHEHYVDAKIEHSLLTQDSVFLYLAPSLYSEEASMYSEFDIDIENGCIDVKRYNFEFEQNGFIGFDKDKVDLRSLFEKRQINKHAFYLSKTMKKKLNEYGVQLTHNKVSEIHFNKLYVHPQFRVISKFDVNYENEIVDYPPLVDSIKLNKIDDMNRVFVTGESDYGKTSLLKYYFSTLSDLGFVPILCDFDNKKRLDNVNRLSNYIYQEFEDQYSHNQLVKFKDVNPKKRFLLVDNIDKYDGNLSLLLLALSKYLDKYPNILITSTDKFIFDPFSKTDSTQQNDDFIDNFDKYELLEFRNYLREKLINKWVLLGDEEIEIKERLKKVTKFERMINNLVKKNLLKPLPLYLVIIMQSYDMGRKLDNTFSSRPHFYNYLIIDAYFKLPFDNYEITEFEKYLTHLAYFITQNNLSLTKEEINDFHIDYVKRMKISPRLEKIYYFNNIETYILDAKILKVIKGIYSFNHPYHYCFYLSKYLVNPRNIGSDDTILNLIENIHMELAANTLNFVIYHSNDDMVYSLIKEKSMSILGSIPEFQMEDDIKKINDFYKDYNPFKDRQLSYVDDIEKCRADKNRMSDKIEEEIKEYDEQLKDENEEVLDFEFIKTMNTSVRTLEVMGGIIKHGIGVFDGNEKTNITRDTVEFGLRLITYFLEKIESVTDHLFSDIERSIESDKKEKSNSEILEEFRKVIYQLLSPSIYSFVVKIADSIANTRDDIIFKEVLEEKNSVVCQIIDFTIEIFFFGVIDFNKMEVFLDNNKSNTIATSSLIHLVGAYNQRFQISRVELQKFNSLLNKFNFKLSKNQSRLILDNNKTKYKEDKTY